MTLFCWTEDWATDYTSGCAIVAAETLEEARQILEKEFGEWRKDDIERPPDKIIPLPCESQVVHDQGGGS